MSRLGTIIFIFTLAFAHPAFAVQMLQFEGVIDPIDDSKVHLRTPTQDITLSVEKLDSSVKKLVGQKTRQKLKIDESAIIERKNTPMGVRADCTEMPTDIEELESIAKNSDDMLDFLKKIPAGSMQAFTLITNTLSLHRGVKDENGEGEVSPLWPRVLRSSVDGKLTVSFVCDPKNPTYGKVEIIHFSDKDKTFKTVEFNFGHPQYAKVPKNDRIHHSPKSCVSCHGGSEYNGKTFLKPNWPEYFQWSDCKENRGIQMYGGNDDRISFTRHRNVPDYKLKQMGCTQEEIKEQSLKEFEDYKKFRDLQKSNACFNTLPWADKTKDPGSFESKFYYDYYPYSEFPRQEIAPSGKRRDIEEFGMMNYSLRPNLRFTDTYSHLLAQSLAHRLKENENYDRLKYMLAMEQAQCRISEDEVNAVNEYLPFDLDFYLMNKQLGGSKYLYQFSEQAGLKHADWTMEFQEKKNTNYQAAMPVGRNVSNDLSIPEVVGGEILKDIGKENSRMTKFAQENISRGVEKVFGKKFSCIDDLGGSIVTIARSSQSEPEICAALRAEHELNLKKFTPVLKCNVGQGQMLKPIEKLGAAVIKVTEEIGDSIGRGKKLVEADSKGKCVLCHSPNVELLPKHSRFIASEKDSNKDESLKTLNKRKHDLPALLEKKLINDKSMPPMANELTDQDRRDVINYINSLIKM